MINLKAFHLMSFPCTKVYYSVNLNGYVINDYCYPDAVAVAVDGETQRLRLQPIDVHDYELMHLGDDVDDVHGDVHDGASDVGESSAMNDVHDALVIEKKHLYG